MHDSLWLAFFQKLQGLPPEVRANFNVRIPCNSAGIMSRAVHPDPLRRFQTAHEMLEAVRQAEDEQIFTIFISYRVASDAVLARMLFDQLNNTLTPRGRHLVKVYLDSQRLKDGEDWEAGFSAGLTQSRIFVPLISHGFTSPMAGAGVHRTTEAAHKARLKGEPHDPEDNVLKEAQIALELLWQRVNRTEGILLQKIVPIVVGQVDQAGSMRDFDPLLSDAEDQFPDRVSWPSTTSACQVIQQRYGVDVDSRASQWTVKETMIQLVANKSIQMWTLGKKTRTARRLGLRCLSTIGTGIDRAEHLI